MSRRRRAEKREIPPDPVYGNLTLAKFINKLMMHGKKAVARRIVYHALEEFAKKSLVKVQLKHLSKHLRMQNQLWK